MPPKLRFLRNRSNVFRIGTHLCPKMNTSAIFLRSSSESFCLAIFSHNGCTCIQCANAPPPRRIIGYQCTNPHCGKLLTNVFTYDQHRNYATRAGTLCASIKMREGLTAGRRADHSSAILSALPRRGNKRDARTKRDAHRWLSFVALPTCLPETPVRNSDEISTHGGHALNSSKCC